MKIDTWAIVATGAGAGLMLFATELAKVIPGPDDQILAAAGTITALCAILLQYRKQGPANPTTPPTPPPEPEKKDGKKQ